MIGSNVRRSAKFGLHTAGWYAQRIVQRTFPGVLVLCYHGLRSPFWRSDERSFPDLHISPETFEGHCEVLRETCHPIDIDRWRAAIQGRATLPERPVLLTFDDGYRSVFDVARPILKKYGLRATVFICTQPMLERRRFWFDESSRDELPSLDFENDPLCPMLPEQVRVLADEGFEIGVHTTTHPVLASQSADRQRLELASCRETIEEWTGRRPAALAYPFGKPNTDYSAETVSIARDLGFDFGFTTQPDFARPGQPPLERSRFLVLAEVSPAELAHRVALSWHQ